MADSSLDEYIDPRGGDEELVSELLQTVKKAHRLRHLYDILRGDTYSPDRYYGKNEKSFDDAKRWASLLASRYPSDAVEFMNRASEEFTHYNLKRNTVVDFLAERGIPRDVFEELTPSWTELLLLAYHTLYDPDAGVVTEYELLLAHSRLFKHRSNYAYQYPELDLTDLDGRITAFVRSHNQNKSRPLTINHHSIDDEEVVIDFYQESARVAQRVFDIRVEDEHGDPLQPQIKYESTYAIKALSANISKEDDYYEVTYSKSTDKWERFLGVFFEDVFNVTDPLDDEQRKRTESVKQVLDSAFDALSMEDATDDDVIEAVDEPIDQLAEVASESGAAEELEMDTEQLDSVFASIELVGIRVRGVEEALTDTFQVSSTATLRDWTDKNVTAEDSLKRVVSDADPKSIGFIFRGMLRGEDEPPEEFILQDGVWKAGPGGVSDGAMEILNVLFQPHDE